MLGFSDAVERRTIDKGCQNARGYHRARPLRERSGRIQERRSLVIRLAALKGVMEFCTSSEKNADIYERL